MSLPPTVTRWEQSWHVTTAGGGTITPDGDGLVLTDPVCAAGYCNAQITDYDYATFTLPDRPPLRLTVTAHASAGGAALRGTAGFGFWNHPASPETRRLALPRTAWFFFGSPPGDLALAYGVPGSGWKAATLDATRPRAWLLAPFAPLAVLLMRKRRRYRRLYPLIQARVGISEVALDPALLATPHTYTLDWRADSLVFAVDGRRVLATPDAPRAPMGFVAWIDNQFAIVSPRGRFGWGTLPLDAPQSLTLLDVRITRL